MKKFISVIALTLLTITCATAQTTTAKIKDTYPTLTTGSLASARLVDLPAGALLTSGQIKITQKDLDAEIAKAPADVRPQLKRNLFFLMQKQATEMFLNHEATAWAKQNPTAAAGQDDVVKAYLMSLTTSASVTDEELKSYFDKNKDMMGSTTFDQAKGQLKEYLLGEKRQDIINAYLATIGNKYEIDVDKTWTAKQYSAAMDNVVDKARKSGLPTMVDFGSTGCRPCDMLAPILESLKTEYAGKINIVFVNVNKEQILATRYGVQSIPFQIFYDKNGKEVFRHIGFFPKEDITAKFTEMGVK